MEGPAVLHQSFNRERLLRTSETFGRGLDSLRAEPSEEGGGQRERSGSEVRWGLGGRDVRLDDRDGEEIAAEVGVDIQHLRSTLQRLLARRVRRVALLRKGWVKQGG